MRARLALSCSGALMGAMLMLLSSGAYALDYRSITAPSILYDAPSSKAKPLYIINAGTPVEAVVVTDGWVKVRDNQGTMAWVDAKQLDSKRTVQVRVDRAQIMAQPNDKAPLVFEASRDVVLDLLEVTGDGWVKVAHRDGQVGYVKILQVWGL